MPKFLIYSMFTVHGTPAEWKMANSVIIDSAESEEEAKEKIRVYEEKSNACAVSRGHSSYRYLPNQN